MSLVQDWQTFKYVRLKWCALQDLLLYMRCFRNWRAVWEATHERAAMPPLELRSGLVIHHGPGDDPLFLYREIFLQHCYDSAGFYIPSAGDTVLDIGANIGVFMLYLQERSRRVRVHCFEPAAETRAQLTRNVVQNVLQECVSVHGFAVADRVETVKLRQAALTGHRSLFASTHVSSTEFESVPCVRLEEALELCGVEKIDLLKIDVEGAEVEILEGADPKIWERIDRIALEFHDRFRAGGRERCLDVLRRAGYNKLTVQTFEPDHLNGAIWASREGRVRAES